MVASSTTVPPLHRLDLETYEHMVASGALEGEHVELLDGLVVEMSPQSPSHAAVLEAAGGPFRPVGCSCARSVSATHTTQL